MLLHVPICASVLELMEDYASETLNSCHYQIKQKADQLVE